MLSRLGLFKGALLCASAWLAAPSYASDIDFDFSGSYRLRYETLQNPIFPTDASSRSRSNDRISSRVLLKGQAKWEHWNATVEIQDSRAFLDDNDPSLTSSQVNTLEPLQFFLRYSDVNDYVKSVTVGRMTLDHGSRRLLARGVYRNTQNAFDGITVDTEYQKWAIRGFYLLPVSRLPSASALIEDNERAFDKSYSERKIFGFYATSPEKAWNLHSYWFKESDGADLATRNRDLYTLAAEYSTTIGNGWKANAELIGQTGTTRQTTAADDMADLDVRAWMAHAHIGRKVNDSTFLRAEIDYASGDNNSDDDTVHSPDSLYGVRRFDFGPTDVYQGFRRSNIIAPGLRSVTKVDKHEVMVGYKAVWYDKVEAGADDFMGQQLEVRWRYKALPDLRLEFGGAYLHKGDALEAGDYADDSQFAYTAFLYSF